MSEDLRIVVLIKQVPDTSSKTGVNPDGTVDRARAKKMMNPFDKFALQKALEAKAARGGEIIVISMGPPPAIEVLYESLEYGADKGYLLTDRRLAASDTLATAYALSRAIQSLGKVDIIFTGLQTTDGDTAQTGPQIAERLNIPQVTYCEKMEISDGLVRATRVIEGGVQRFETATPVLITVANSAEKLRSKRFIDVYRMKELSRDEEELKKRIFTISLDDIDADPKRTGLVGSPTVVGKTWKMGEIGGECVVYKGDSPSHEVELLVGRLAEDGRGIEELLK
ncbi:MAG: electron transfer flavoprotein subunit beta/FixA family protein [Candidatus Nitrospinota bacterium M3_3B_026]